MDSSEFQSGSVSSYSKANQWGPSLISPEPLTPVLTLVNKQIIPIHFFFKSEI